MFTDKNGRPITPDELVAEIGNAIQSEVEKIKVKTAEEMLRKYGLDTVQCPEHNTGLTNVRLEPVSPGSEHHQVVYDECCEKLVAELNRAARLID